MALLRGEPFITPGRAAVDVVEWLRVNGGHSRPREMPTIEALFVDFDIMEPEACVFDIEGRGLNPRYAALEILSLLSGQPVDTHQRHIAKGFVKFQDESIQRGNYGIRIRNQLRDFIRKLSLPDSRQAVMTIFDGNRDLLDDSRDVPCTLAVQGFVRDNIFYMRTMMRSNDAYLGLPYDLMQFCALQTTIAEILQVDNGFYRHSVGSMHLYMTDLPAVRNMGDEITMDRDGEPMWFFPDVVADSDDVMDRLNWVVRFCQDALFGQAQTPSSAFETWLLASL